jgi:hypothetical protein
VWWYTPIIPELGRRRQENHEFKASLDYMVSPCLKKPTDVAQWQSTSLGCASPWVWYPALKKKSSLSHSY